MADRQVLHDLRQQAHKAGIEGSSKMSEQELREALSRVERDEKPDEAKRAAKGWT